MSDIILDPSIRDWVVLPMVVIIVMTGLVRHYISVLLQNDKMQNVDDTRRMQAVRRAQMLRANSKFLNPRAFTMRKNYFIATEKNDGFKGLLREKIEDNNMMNPMMNPNGMMDMMKGNMTFMVSNMVMMGLVGTFFDGFVLVKVPFSLTQRFKMMLQRGIEIPTLDVSYVSSVSWYFLVMFGMRGFISLVLGEESAGDDTKAMQMQMGMGSGPQMGFDAKKFYKEERESLKIYAHEYALDDVEKKMLGDVIEPKSTPERSAPAPRPSERKSSKYNKVPRRTR